MQYSPKLKNAMEEIKGILDAYDIAGAVMLHTPGHGEHYIKLDPSYSCAKLEGGKGIRFKATKEMYGTEKKRNQAISDTANMFDLLGEMTGKTALNCIEVVESLEKQFEIKRDRGGFTSHSAQNN